MVTQLRVVNDCLAVMGEAPLNSLQESHEYKAAALNRLKATSERLQVRDGNGWWFNCETLTLTVNASDLRIYLPADIASMTVLDKRPTLAQRGRVLYNLDEGTDKFEVGTSYTARLVRLLPFESIPLTVAEYIAVETVLGFQNEYDGDQTKTRNLMQEATMRRMLAMSEHVRNRKVNMLDNSVGLSRIRNIVRQARRF